MWQSLLDLDRELLLALNGDGGAFWDAFFYFVTARLTWIPLYAVLLYAVWRRFGTRGLLWVVLFLGATVIADDQICNFFKHNVPKLRPTHTPGVESLVHTVRDYRGTARFPPMRPSASRSRCSLPCCSAGGGMP